MQLLEFLNNLIELSTPQAKAELIDLESFARTSFNALGSDVLLRKIKTENI